MIKMLILLFISFYLFLSCKEIKCPSFPDDLVEYFPKILNDTVLYSNQIDTIRLIFIKDSISKPQNFKSNCDCICSVEKGQTTNYNSTYSCRIQNEIVAIGENNEDISFTVILNEESLYKNYTSKDQINDTIEFLENTNTRFTYAKSIKNKGLVEFYDKQFDCTWKLVEN